jgi:hypothetical protein
MSVGNDWVDHPHWGVLAASANAPAPFSFRADTTSLQDCAQCKLFTSRRIWRQLTRLRQEIIVAEPLEVVGDSCIRLQKIEASHV